MKGLSVIIPVKSPEPYLSTLVWRIYHSLNRIKHEMLIQREEGLTNAVIKGVQLARFNTVVVMDADGSHDPVYLPKMYHLMNLSRKYDMMVKYDLIVGTKIHDETGWKRKLISKVYRWFARKLLNIQIEDPMSGLVMGKTSVFQRLQPITGYKFLLQLLLHNPKPEVFQYPIKFKQRQGGKSKASLHTGLKTLHSIISLWWKQRIKK